MKKTLFIIATIVLAVITYFIGKSKDGGIYFLPLIHLIQKTKKHQILNLPTKLET
jgi:hypothetical protein